MPGAVPAAPSPPAERPAAPGPAATAPARPAPSGRPGVERGGPRARGLLRSPFRAAPGRLRLAGLVLVVLTLLFGALTAWQVHTRQSAADAVNTRSGPLADRAASLYWSLADADASAAAGFLNPGQEPANVRARYQGDIEQAAEALAAAATHTDSNSAEQAEITTLTRELPSYTGLVETARTNNRQGLPVGGAYLRTASDQMETTLLPAAEKLYRLETRQLAADHGTASSLPWLALADGVLALAAIVWVSRLLYRRTNRVFNPGLLAAGTAVVLTLAWLCTAQLVARAHFADSAAYGSDPIGVINQARIAGLKARAAENLTLVAHGDGDDYVAQFDRFAAKLTGRPGHPGLVGRALAEADGHQARVELRTAKGHLDTWMKLHRSARKADDSGKFSAALRTTVGHDGIAGPASTTEGAFDAMDLLLGNAAAADEQRFQASAQDGRDALDLLAVGGAVLCVLGAGGVVVGVGRRLAEYR